jgi:vitellogenic carboxypeptidase-like protein
LQQFYAIYPAQLSNELYITGESYGGKYVPSIAYKIHTSNAMLKDALDAGIDISAFNPVVINDGFNTNAVSLPFRGLAVGDGWIDPVEMIPAYPEMMYNMGLIDVRQRRIAQEYCDKTVRFIKQQEMLNAFDVWDQFLNGDIWPYANWFHNQTGSNDYDNFLNTNAPVSFGYFASYVNLPDVRKMIHVGNSPFQDGHDCEMHLLTDFMVSMKPRLEVLLNAVEGYKIVIYSGQLDVIIGAALTDRFLPTVNWYGQSKFTEAERKVWRITDSDPDVAGYVKQVDNLTQVIIKGAGHIAPYDQPSRTMNMIDRMINNIPYKNLPNPAPSSA